MPVPCHCLPFACFMFHLVGNPGNWVSHEEDHAVSSFNKEHFFRHTTYTVVMSAAQPELMQTWIRE